MPDAAIPTFINVTPGNESTYEFEGHVVATGIDLPDSNTVIGESNSRLSWLLENTQQSFIYGHHDAAIGYLTLLANAGKKRNAGFIQAAAQGPGTKKATILASSPNVGECKVAARVEGASFVEKTILEEDGSSEFIQLGSGPSRLRAKIFSGVFTIPAGGGESSNYIEISHGFGNPCFAFSAQQVGGDGFSIAITTKMVLNSSAVSRWRCTASSAMPGGSPINFEFLFILYG